MIEVRPTSVWDTDDNVINTKIVKLRLDPRFDDAQAEADEAAAAQYAHIAHAAHFNDLAAVRSFLRRDRVRLDQQRTNFSWRTSRVLRRC